MAFISGQYVICAASECDSVDLETVSESFDETDRIFVGEQRCQRCGCAMLYTRAAKTPEEINMAKKKRVSAHAKRHTTKPRTKTPAGSRPNGRVNTFKANGGIDESMEAAPESVTIGEAMRRAVEDLGDVKIDNTLAPLQMRELAECFEDITRRRAAFAQKADEAKTAKKSLESATDLLLEKLRSFTHPKALPLFDQQEAEADRENMLDAADAD